MGKQKIKEEVKKENSNVKKYLLLLVVIIIITIIGYSFAYYVMELQGENKSEVKVEIGVIASLFYSTTGTLSIEANSQNFYEGAGNLSSSSEASALLTAEPEIIYNYTMSLNVEKNDFEYTTVSEEPELILTITGSDGEVIKSIDGLNYVDLGTVKGFDITNINPGKYNIVKYHEIEVEAGSETKKDDYKIELTFINLSTDQYENTQKTFVAEIKFEN